jgi:hypothetical protein
VCIARLPECRLPLPAACLPAQCWTGGAGGSGGQAAVHTCRVYWGACCTCAGNHVGYGPLLQCLQVWQHFAAAAAPHDMHV